MDANGATTPRDAVCAHRARWNGSGRRTSILKFTTLSCMQSYTNGVSSTR